MNAIMENLLLSAEIDGENTKAATMYRQLVYCLMHMRYGGANLGTHTISILEILKNVQGA